jgi:hypothetical protein
MALRRTAALAIAWVACVAAGPGASRLPDAAVRAIERLSPDDVRGYVERLASDAMGGRGVGEPGNRAAEEFVCTALRATGVTPAGAEGSCYQPVDIYRPSPGRRARLRVSREDGSAVIDLPLGDDFYPLPESGSAAASGPIVFAGHGIVAPAQKHDDYQGVNARGAIVFVLESAPPELRGDLSTIETKIANAASRGAAALITISDAMADYRLIWPAQGRVSRDSTYRLVSSLHPEFAVAALSERNGRLIRRMLADGTALTGTVTPDLASDSLTIRNVLGIVEGRDPSRRGEAVVVGAHLDHDGTDAQGRVYNGADDNASGTAAVLAAATAFARAAAEGERPARSVIFALWNGEEKGSLGAEAFVGSPPGRRVIANLNLDMVGRHEEIPDPTNWRWAGLPKVDRASSGNTLHVLGYSYSPDLAAELRDANDAVGLTLLEDYDVGAQDLLKRSDHWPFVSHGIPALFLTTGLHPDYHTPQDDVERIDFGKLARVARLAARAAWIVADGPAPALKKR